MKKLKNNKHIRGLDILSQLAGMLDCSLARYLLNARPWARRPYLLLGAIARRLANEHEHYAGEIVRLLHARRRYVNGHTYPMEFTYFNDLSLEYLAPRILEHQQRIISFADAASKELPSDYEVQRVLKRLLVSLRKYESLLAELLAPRRLAPHAPTKGRLAATAASRSPSRANTSSTSKASQTAA
jgi:hypothetical protein